MAGTRRLIVGLGNPTAKYDKTRHNVGFVVLDRLIGAGQFRSDGRAEALVADLRLRGRPVTLAKPQTYMNRSGYSVHRLLLRLALAPQEVIVVADDLNLPLGMIRIRARGSAGGHNGMQSIIDQLDTDAFARVRIGIRGAFERGRQRRFVLTPFTAEERPAIEKAVMRAVQAVTTCVTDGLTMAMNQFNRRVAAATDSAAP